MDSSSSGDQIHTPSSTASDISLTVTTDAGTSTHAIESVRLTLSRGCTLTEHRELEDAVIRWVVDEIHRVDGSVIGYTFKVEEGEHREYFDADIVDELMDERVLRMERSEISKAWTATDSTSSGTFTSNVPVSIGFNRT
ncbi:hypothetical protein HUG10_21325 (plasmid) [Halorarum halophilum]|uniref:Uncharacterized protein n=1 Tax=Halorarum halophilum TaxID=2743090 RepID=A0A7D5GKW9_9EURY|nr:hypothetical protein [Halobaculum halophilum]QLG30131.1 hypothetical protein HUG10_21325 [Halobaculum halophilum]